MVALTNFAVLMHQHKNINTEQDLNSFNKSVEAMRYTPLVDLALSIICSLGAMIALPAALGTGLTIAALAFCVSGASMAKSQNAVADLALTVNLAWHTRARLNSLEAQLAKYN